VQEELLHSLNQPPTLQELIAAVRSHRGSTDSGAAGLTYNMLKGWPEDNLTSAHTCLSIL